VVPFQGNRRELRRVGIHKGERHGLETDGGYLHRIGLPSIECMPKTEMTLPIRGTSGEKTVGRIQSDRRKGEGAVGTIAYIASDAYAFNLGGLLHAMQLQAAHY